MYMLLATPFEERDLTEVVGDRYIVYRQQVSTSFPMPRKRRYGRRWIEMEAHAGVRLEIRF